MIEWTTEKVKYKDLITGDLVLFLGSIHRVKKVPTNSLNYSDIDLEMKIEDLLSEGDSKFEKIIGPQSAIDLYKLGK